MRREENQEEMKEGSRGQEKRVGEERRDRGGGEQRRGERTYHFE